MVNPLSQRRTVTQLFVRKMIAYYYTFYDTYVSNYLPD